MLAAVTHIQIQEHRKIKINLLYYYLKNIYIITTKFFWSQTTLSRIR